MTAYDDTRHAVARAALEGILCESGLTIEESPANVTGPLGGVSSQIIGTDEQGHRFIVCVYCDDRTLEET